MGPSLSAERPWSRLSIATLRCVLKKSICAAIEPMLPVAVDQQQRLALAIGLEVEPDAVVRERAAGRGVRAIGRRRCHGRRGRRRRACGGGGCSWRTRAGRDEDEGKDDRARRERGSHGAVESIPGLTICCTRGGGPRPLQSRGPGRSNPPLRPTGTEATRLAGALVRHAPWYAAVGLSVVETTESDGLRRAEVLRPRRTSRLNDSLRYGTTTVMGDDDTDDPQLFLDVTAIVDQPGPTLPDRLRVVAGTLPT